MKLILTKYFVLTFLVGFLSSIKFRCDYSFIQVGWLKYHRIPATWRDARLRCRYEGGMLASPTSSYLKATMMRSVGSVDIFTGIHDFLSHGNFYTIDGIPLEAIPHVWAANEPDNKDNNEKCIAMNSEGSISDVNCDVTRPYMCFRPFSNVGANICGTPDSEYRFNTRTNKCYKFHTTPRTYKRAHFVCSAEGGHLVIINSNTESEVIRDLFAQYPDSAIVGINFDKYPAFIGFHNYDESADWTTLDGQTLKDAGFSQFGENQPDNATTGEYCGSVFRNGLLNDLWCENHYAFICEKDANYPPVCDSSIF